MHVCCSELDDNDNGSAHKAVSVHCRWQVLVSKLPALKTLVLPSLRSLNDDFNLDQLGGPMLQSVSIVVDTCTAAGFTSVSTSEMLGSLTINYTDLQTLVRF